MLIASESEDDIISDIQIMTYAAPRWGSKAIGTALIRKDSQARYYVDTIWVVDVRVDDLFTVLVCVDGTTHYVFTAFFQKIDRQASAE